MTEALAAVEKVLVLTCCGLLLHKGVCQGGLAGSEEVGQANCFQLDLAVGGVPHTADQLGDAAGVTLQHCVKGLRPVAYKGEQVIKTMTHMHDRLQT